MSTILTVLAIYFVCYAMFAPFIAYHSDDFSEFVSASKILLGVLAVIILLPAFLAISNSH